MIFSKITVLGCGTVGAPLILDLAKKKICHVLEFYDYDIVDSTADYIYPFPDSCREMSKSHCLRILTEAINPSLEVISRHGRVSKDSELDGFILDCRDAKTSDVKTNCRISLDGSILVLDSRDDDPLMSFPHYYFSKSVIKVQRAVVKIIEYLQQQEYKNRTMETFSLS